MMSWATSTAVTPFEVLFMALWVDAATRVQLAAREPSGKDAAASSNETAWNETNGAAKLV